MSCFSTKRHTNLTQSICQLQLLGDLCLHLEVKFGEVMMFACEVECNDTVAAQRQLTLYLYSAQYQRRALGFDDGQAFGATVVKKHFDSVLFEMGERESRAYSLSILFVFALSSEKFVFLIKPQIFLDSFPAFIYSCLFLCKIAEHITPSISLAMCCTWPTK